MNPATLRRLRAADAAERQAAEKLEAARGRLSALLAAAADEGASVRELAEITGRAKSQVHRVVSR